MSGDLSGGVTLPSRVMAVGYHRGSTWAKRYESDQISLTEQEKDVENWRLSAFITTVSSMLPLCFLWISSFSCFAWRNVLHVRWVVEA